MDPTDRVITNNYCIYIFFFLFFTVDPQEVPDYYQIIKQPMDFSTIRKKLEVKNHHIIIYILTTSWAFFWDNLKFLTLVYAFTKIFHINPLITSVVIFYPFYWLDVVTCAEMSPSRLPNDAVCIYSLIRNLLIMTPLYKPIT